MFLSALVLGVVGLVAMAFLGVQHGGHHGHDTGAHDAGHGHHDGYDHGLEGLGAKLLVLLSPRVLFSLALGYGTTGLLLERFLSPVFAVLAAIVGALLFEGLLVGPYWKTMFRFVSAPATMLGDVAGTTVTAVTAFDVNGAGLVRVELDGEVRQVLGVLRPQERGRVQVRVGEALRVVSFNDQGQCVVTKETVKG